jgi:hypothetical protein
MITLEILGCHLDLLGNFWWDAWIKGAPVLPSISSKLLKIMASTTTE